MDNNDLQLQKNHAPNAAASELIKEYNINLFMNINSLAHEY